LVLAHGKVFLKNDVSFFSECGGEKNTLPCVVKKTHGKQDLCRVFISGARQSFIKK
jgi:hypothetical protein